MDKLYDLNYIGLDSTYCNIDINGDSIIGNTCGSFNGVNQYAIIPSTAKITGPMTINLWAYMDDWTEFGNGMRLISCTESGGWNFEPINNNAIRFTIYDGQGATYRPCQTGMLLSNLTSGWHMFTALFDGSNGKMYIDGELIDTGATFTNAPNGTIGYHSSNAIIIGAEAGTSNTSPAGTPYYFKGKLNDLKIYGTALSEADIQSEYKKRGAVDNLSHSHFKQIIEGAGRLENIITSTQNRQNITVINNPVDDIIQFPIGTTGMQQYTGMPTPIANHIYYGSIWFMHANSPFVTADCRFEWYVGDNATSTIIFAYKDSDRAPEAYKWYKISGRHLLSTVTSGNWIVRNFQVNAESLSWTTKPFIVDLTEAFGAGNEPTQEWCDEHLNYEYPVIPTNFSLDNKGVTDCTNICECGRRMRYIRVTNNGSNANPYSHLEKVNILKVNQEVNCLADAEIDYHTKIISGYGKTTNNTYFEVSSIWILDIGQIENVAAIMIRRYYQDGRYYYGSKIEGSLDNSNWFTIWDSHNTGSFGNDITFNTYVETEQGRWFTVEPEKFEILDNGTIITSQFIEK